VIEKYEYGIVQVISGEHKGKVGFYDDDEWQPNRAIVYFERPLLGDYYLFRQLKEATPEQQQEYRRTQLTKVDPLLRIKAGVDAVAARAELNMTEDEIRVAIFAQHKDANILAGVLQENPISVPDPRPWPRARIRKRQPRLD